jgi:hypothetical protein
MYSIGEIHGLVTADGAVGVNARELTAQVAVHSSGCSPLGPLIWQVCYLKSLSIRIQLYPL